MTIDLNRLDPADFTPATVIERAAIAPVDAVFHDQHGDSTQWASFEWDAYHRAIAKALERFRHGA